MSFFLSPSRSLRDLFSASAEDLSLRLRLKTRAKDVLDEWGVRTPDPRVHFVQPSESPASASADDGFADFPASADEPLADEPLTDDSLDAVAGGWDEARDLAGQPADRGIDATAWRSTDPWL